MIILSLAPMVASTVANGPRSPWDAISLIIVLRIWRVKRVIDGERPKGPAGWRVAHSCSDQRAQPRGDRPRGGGRRLRREEPSLSLLIQSSVWVPLTTAWTPHADTRVQRSRAPLMTVLILLPGSPAREPGVPA